MVLDWVYCTKHPEEVCTHIITDFAGNFDVTKWIMVNPDACKRCPYADASSIGSSDRDGKERKLKVESDDGDKHEVVG